MVPVGSFAVPNSCYDFLKQQSVILNCTLIYWLCRSMNGKCHTKCGVLYTLLIGPRHVKLIGSLGIACYVH